MTNIVPELPPFSTEGADIEPPTARDLRLALLGGSFDAGMYCVGLMTEAAIADAGLGYATTHLLLAMRTAALDNESTNDCRAIWALCRARTLQQLAREWEDGDGTQGLRCFAAAESFVSIVCDEADRLPSVTNNPEEEVWSIPANEAAELEPVRKLQGHLLRIESIAANLRTLRAEAIREMVLLSLGNQSQISSQLEDEIERVRSLDEPGRVAVLRAVVDAAAEWTNDAARNRATCEGAALGLAEALGRTDTPEWSERLYLAARARARSREFGSWYTATLALMESLDLELVGASENAARRKRLERDFSDYVKQGRIVVAQSER